MQRYTKNMKAPLIFTFIFISSLIYGQNRSLNIGFNNNGLSFGNSKKNNGLRLNLWDKNVDAINGLNISGLSGSAKTNGLSIGLIANSDSTVNGISIAGLAGVSKKINGIAIGGIGVVSDKINGFGISGLGIVGDTLNGLFCSYLGYYVLKKDSINRINGVTLGILSGSIAKDFNGLSIGILFNEYSKQNGIAIAAYNKTTELHGFQFGLLNYAGNNKKLFRWLPFVNFNLRKKADRSQRL